MVMFWSAVDAAEPYYAAAEALLFFYILVAHSTHDHYTWWNLFIVFGYDLGVTLAFRWAFLRVFIKRYWLAVTLSAVTVVAGVIVMSALSCELLSKIYHEEGPLAYTAGNFVVHYLPLCRLALWPNFETKHVREMSALAAAPIVLYSLLFNPNSIYECSKTSDALSAFILVLLPLLLFLAASFIRAVRLSSYSSQELSTKLNVPERPKAQ